MYLPFKPGVIEVIPDTITLGNILAVSEHLSGFIHFISLDDVEKDPNSSKEKNVFKRNLCKPFKSVKLHKYPIVFLKNNISFSTMVSLDSKGFIEY